MCVCKSGSLLNMLQSLGEFCLVTSICEAWQRSKIQHLWIDEGPTFSHLWTKVHKVLGDCVGPFVVSNAVRRLSVAWFTMKVFTIKFLIPRKKLQKIKFLCPIFWEGPQIFMAVYKHGLLSTICPCIPWSPSDTGNNAEYDSYGGWVKWRYYFWLFVDQNPWSYGTV